MLSSAAVHLHDMFWLSFQRILYATSAYMYGHRMPAKTSYSGFNKGNKTCAS